MITEVVTGKNGQSLSVHANGKSAARSEYYWLSADEKPMAGVDNADIGYEMDTGKVFLFDDAGGRWLEQ